MVILIRQEPSRSKNDVLTVEDSLNGSGWFRLVPGVVIYFLLSRLLRSYHFLSERTDGERG